MLIHLHFDCQWWLDIYSLQFIKWLSMQFYYHFNYQWLLCIIIFINGSVMIWKGINFTVYINNVSRMIIYYLCFRWLYIIIYYIYTVAQESNDQWFILKSSLFIHHQSDLSMLVHLDIVCNSFIYHWHNFWFFNNLLLL